jgi:hypothetical protein
VPSVTSKHQIIDLNEIVGQKSASRQQPNHTNESISNANTTTATTAAPLPTTTIVKMEDHFHHHHQNNNAFNSGLVEDDMASQSSIGSNFSSGKKQPFKNRQSLDGGIVRQAPTLATGRKSKDISVNILFFTMRWKSERRKKK